jgi:uncharacterized protein (UPF0332 family)
MDGSSFLEVAERLLDGETEADWRSAVSRAYYAAFHVGRQFLMDCGFHIPRNEQAHAALILRLGNSKYPQMIDSGRYLSDLRASRNAADYDLNFSFAHTEACDLEITAANIIEIIQLVAKEPTVKAKITDAIKTYERDVLRQVTWKA